MAKADSRTKATRAGEAAPRPTGSKAGKSTKEHVAREPKAPRAGVPKAAADRQVPASPDLGEVKDLLRDIRTALDRLVREPSPVRTPDAGETAALSQAGNGETAELDQALITIRRVVGEVLDRAMEQVMIPLVGLRLALSRALAAPEAPSGPGGDALRQAVTAGAAELDRVLLNLGAEPFRPARGEFFDPLIHREAGETNQEGLEPGAIAAVLLPGFKTGRGRVIAPASVTVNRG